MQKEPQNSKVSHAARTLSYLTKDYNRGISVLGNTSMYKWLCLLDRERLSYFCFPNCFPTEILILWETLFTCLTWIDMMSSLSKNQGVFKIAVFSHCFPETKNQQLEFLLSCWFSVWTSQGLNLGPPDYESVKIKFFEVL